MSKRLSSALMPSVLATVAGLFMLTAALTAQQPPAGQPPTDAKNVGDLRTTEQRNDEIFRKFQRELLSLAQKLERSDAPEDKERAKVIYAALDLAKKEGVEGQFQKLIAGMAKGTVNPVELDVILGQDKQLNKALREILAVLMTDDESARLKAEIARLEEFLKAAREIKRQQDILRALTDAKKGDPNRLSKSQGELADRTKDLGNKMDGKDGKDSNAQKGSDGGQGGEKGVAKAENKAEAKSGDKAGEGKGDTDQPKGESKDGGKGGDPMKDGPGGAESKGGGEGKPQDGTEKPATEGKGADQAGMGRDSGMPKDGQGGGKEGQPGGKEGQPGGKEGAGGGKEGQGGGKEGQGGKPGGGKQGAQQGDSKGQGDGKGEDKGNQGQQGGDGKNKNDDQQNSQQGGSKGGGQQGEPSQGGGGGGQPQPQQPQNQTPGRKQLQEAYPFQKDAEDLLKKDNRDNAGKQEDKAIEKLAQAIQELEKRLKQLREEELLKTLAALEARCNRMLQMQIEVYEATKAIDGIIVKNNNQKSSAEIQKSQQQADKETEIIREAGMALKLLESEGSAVAFARVLEEVREDMIAVQRRLADARVDKDTQTIEENIISILKDMILALKKAQQEIQQQQGQSPPPGNQKPGQKPLIDLLAELKLLKAMQIQVNSRTKMYGDKSSGEQASDPILQAELKQLAARQQKLQEMLNDIATGKNK